MAAETMKLPADLSWMKELSDNCVAKETVEVKTEYKRNLQNNYLILEAPDVDAENNYGLRMAEQNQVKGLLPIHESRKDGKLYLHYEITSKQTLENVYEKKVMGYQDILSVLSGIRDTLENMRKYLLSPQKILFAPELIYMQPERKGLMLCYYVKENECPIQMLSEFILKRLDHRDRQAVALGYGFFERASGENFSLAESLKEILATFGETAHPPCPDGSRINEPARPEEPDEMKANRAGTEYYERYRAAEVRTDAGTRNETYGPPESEVFRGSSSVPREVSSDGRGGLPLTEGREAEPFQTHEEPYVIHRERSRNKRKGEHLADRIFSKVHPAVLLSILALTVLLEILIVCGALSLTEGGGCFFLILSVEILINRRILHKKKEKPMEWDEEEESEDYQKLVQEVYGGQAERAEPDPIEETRCLIPKEEDHSLRLVCCSDTASKDKCPDICPDICPVYIGKIRGEADVLLNVPTVSRMHARIQMHQNQCFLKDMNSKNGTFVNGRRLEPQEECVIEKDDIVAFAEVEYRVVKGSLSDGQQFSAY